MDEDTLVQFDQIDAKMREIVYSIMHPEHILFDLDSTLLNTKSIHRFLFIWAAIVALRPQNCTKPVRIMTVNKLYS